MKTGFLIGLFVVLLSLSASAKSSIVGLTETCKGTDDGGFKIQVFRSAPNEASFVVSGPFFGSELVFMVSNIQGNEDKTKGEITFSFDNGDKDRTNIVLPDSPSGETRVWNDSESNKIYKLTCEK